MIDERSIQVFLDELSKIIQLLEILTRNALKEELERIATTSERKRIWALCNGLRSTEEIAKELWKVDLITIEKRGYPKRRFDYIPSDWDVEME